jgi:hypothetical protein
MWWLVALVQTALAANDQGIVAVEDDNPVPEVFSVSPVEQARCPLSGAVCATTQARRMHIVAHLRQPVHGALIVAVFDRDRPDAIAQKQPLLVWDVSSHGARFLGLRISLGPGNAVAKSHTYLVRVVQVRGKERILAEGDVRLD